MTDVEIINHLVETNEPKYNLLKASEELQELALVLTQLALKPNKVKEQEVIDEIGDVKIRMKILKKLFSKKKVKERIEFKLGKFKEYVVNNQYIGNI